jgi:MraZ protein
MFRGRSVHTIDAKNRISIPAGFRVEFERRSDRSPILTNDAACLALYPYEDWCEFEERLLNLSSVDPNVGSYARFMVSGATECPVDKQGRILVPSALREYAGLDREVTVAGVGNRLELWDKTRFNAELSKTQARFGEISSSVAEKLSP